MFSLYFYHRIPAIYIISFSEFNLLQLCFSKFKLLQLVSVTATRRGKVIINSERNEGFQGYELELLDILKQQLRLIEIRPVS